MRYPLIAGNWKMNKSISEAKDFAKEFKALYHESDVRVILCVPYLQIPILVSEFKDINVVIGAENCHFEDSGAYTGEISAKMLKEVGVGAVIIGHSERRKYFNEQDLDVNLKVKSVLKEGLIPIICVGEDLNQREHNFQDKLVMEQVANALQGIEPNLAKNIVIAYEPIWAIGTGRTATPIQAGMMCEVIRNQLIDDFGEEIADEIKILYGGSVTPDTITEIMDFPEVDGALVGGASLDAKKFNEIINF